MIPAIAVARPTSLNDAASLLDDDCSLYCGGTELLLAMRMGLLAPSKLVDLKRIDRLRQIELGDDTLRVGAACTHAQLVRDQQVRAAVPLLAQIESSVGNPRVRTQGSIGGNICFAEPKSDVIAGLIALEATVTLYSLPGTRTMPVSEFIVGAYETRRGDREIVECIDIPTNGRPGVHLKYQTMERPTVSVVISSHSNGIRVVIGAAGDVPVWSDASERTELDIDELISRLDPIEDLSGSGDYKRHVARVYVNRALAEFDQAVR